MKDRMRNNKLLVQKWLEDRGYQNEKFHSMCLTAAACHIAALKNDELEMYWCIYIWLLAPNCPQK